MNNFTHYIFTRFNLILPDASEKKPTPERSIEKGNLVRFNKDWLDMRMRYLRKYCLPSLQAQTVQDFEWVVFVHKSTPEQYIKELNKHTKPYLTDLCDYLAAQDYLSSQKINTDFIITTNLDSDDAISHSYIEEIQENFQEKREYLNITFGYNLRDYESNQEKVYVGKRSLQNPFRSFVEPREKSLSVYYVTHGLSSTIAPVRQIEDKAVWLQVIHGDNLSNRFKKFSNDKVEPFEKIAHLFK